VVGLEIVVTGDDAGLVFERVAGYRPVFFALVKRFVEVDVLDIVAVFLKPVAYLMLNVLVK